MRVLFQPRWRALVNRGGDVGQMERTIAQLERRGVHCDVSVEPTPDLAPYDLVHLYSLGDPYAALSYFVNARRQHKPIVTTPIYWRHSQWLALWGAETAPPEFRLAELAPQERERVIQVKRVEEEIYLAVQQLVIAGAARVFPQSHSEGELLVEDAHAAPEKLRPTYNGIEALYAQGDAARFMQAFGIPQRDYVICVARVSERKNTIGLIRAWRGEREPLVLVGGAPDPAYLELCRREAGPNVYFVGRVGAAQVADALAGAKVFVLPSWWEEASNAAVEAAFAGCNLVMSQHSSARDYFGEHVQLCDPADERSIREAVRAALAAPRDTALAAHIRERFSWERTADVLVEAYADVTAGRAADTLGEEQYTAELARLVELFVNLSALKAPDYETTAARAAEQQAWGRALEAMLAARSRERARVLNFPPLRLARRWLGRV